MQFYYKCNFYRQASLSLLTSRAESLLNHHSLSLDFRYHYTLTTPHFRHRKRRELITAPTVGTGCSVHDTESLSGSLRGARKFAAIRHFAASEPRKTTSGVINLFHYRSRRHVFTITMGIVINTLASEAT